MSKLESKSDYSNEDDTGSCKSFGETTQPQISVQKSVEQKGALGVNNLTSIVCTVKACPSLEPEFNSLMYMSQRLNKDNLAMENKSDRISDISGGIEKALDYSKTIEKMQAPTQKIFESMATQQCLDLIQNRTSTNEDEDLFAFDESSSNVIGALKRIHSNITGRPLPIDESDNIYLCINLEEEADRELLVQLTTVKLPEIYTLKIENFYESDEDLEAFLSDSLTSVWNFLFVSESYWVDIHDYVEKLTTISAIKHMYLKGFLIDNEDSEQLFSCWNFNKLTFESCNLSIEEDFWIDTDKDRSKIATHIPILESVQFIDNELDTTSMTRLMKAIKASGLKYTIKNVETDN